MSERTILTLKERVGLFFEDMKNAPPVSTPREVYNLISQILNALNKYAVIRNSGLKCADDDIKSLSICPISMWVIEQRNPTIYSTSTTRQILYVGQNGSFEFHSKEDDNSQSQLILTKPGFDGRFLEQLFHRQLISA